MAPEYRQPDVDPQTAPGTGRHARGGGRLHYELISCGIGGHVLAGTEAEELRPQDALFVREWPEDRRLRWHRCLRCDAWVALPKPQNPAQRYPPDREHIALPLRGRPLRDKYVLRLIAIERGLHFVVLGALAVALLVFLSHRDQLRGDFYRVMIALHGSLGGPTSSSHSTILEDVRKLLNLRGSSLRALGFITLAYAVLEGVEAVGLWLRRRWAEYLTFIATSVLLVPEIFELTGRISVFKILALILNIVVAVYLLRAKRLFGLRGGGAAERAEIERDSGWAALEAVLPAYHEAVARRAPQRQDGEIRPEERT